MASVRVSVPSLRSRPNGGPGAPDFCRANLASPSALWFLTCLRQIDAPATIFRWGAGTHLYLPVWRSALVGTGQFVLLDIIIAIIIVLIAAVLGIVVHPLLWIIIIVALLWLFFRRGRW
jgi:hypothetical protein